MIELLNSRWLRARGPKVLAGVLVFISVAALYWSSRNNKDFFPRRQEDFPSSTRIDSALAAAETKLKENPQDIAALVELGVRHFQKGKESYIDAINELEEARDLGALDDRIFYCLGIMYQETGLHSFAVEEYRRFLRNRPGDAETRMLLAKLLYQQGKFLEAVSEYERLKFSRPKDPMIEENLGLSLWGAKLTERAVESFNALKGYGPDQAKNAELYLGEIDYERGQYQAALDHFLLSLPTEGSQGLGIPPEKIYSSLALAYQKLNQPEEAKEAWTKTLSFAPKDLKAQAALKELNRRFPPKKPKKAKKP